MSSHRPARTFPTVIRLALAAALGASAIARVAVAPRGVTVVPLLTVVPFEDVLRHAAPLVYGLSACELSFAVLLLARNRSHFALLSLVCVYGASVQTLEIVIGRGPLTALIPGSLALGPNWIAQQIAVLLLALSCALSQLVNARLEPAPPSCLEAAALARPVSTLVARRATGPSHSIHYSDDSNPPPGLVSSRIPAPLPSFPHSEP